MKRSLGFLLLASAMPFIFSCSKEVNNSPTLETRGLVITATREGDDPETRTELVDGKTYWSVGDKISVFFGSGTAGGAEFSSTNTEPVASADFTGVLTAVTGSEEGSSSQKYFWGVYPYSDQNSLILSGNSNVLTTVVKNVQYGVADSYSAGQNIWIGRSTGLELSFKSLLSGIKFTFSRNDITKVVIKGNNGEYLAGEVNVTMDSGVPVVSGVVTGTTSVTLTPEGRDTFLSGPVYRALFLPTNFTKGLTVTFFAADGSVGKRTYGNLNFLRNEPKAANNADSKATFVTPEPVDMGNGLLMAPWNVGATSPEDTGDYFAWGESVSKNNYDWDTYKWGRNVSSLTKYVTDASYGAPDYRMYLTDADDAATRNWGPSWRTPTDKEWNTLLDTNKYTWAWTTDYNSTGTKGYVVTSKSTNKSIFLPAAGFVSGVRRMNTSYGLYWSSVGSSDNTNAKRLHFSSSSQSVQEGQLTYRRIRGLSVRPIYASRKPVESIVYTAEEMDISDDGRPKQVYFYFNPEDAFDRGLHIYTTDPSVVEIDASLHNFVSVDPGGSYVPLTINGPGTTHLIAETPDHSVSITMTINVLSTVSGITLNKTSHTFSNYLENMTPLQLTATVSPSTASQIVYWKSSDESVATVDYDGKVTPVGSGTTTISAMKGSVTATCQVTVDAWVHVTGLKVSGTNIGTYPANSAFGVDCMVVEPSNAHDKTLLWSVSDSEVASVDPTPNSYGQYTVRTKKPGVCILTATTNDGGFSGVYILTVVSAIMNDPLYPGEYMGYVDMGDGLKIAVKNVGARNAWDHGDRFYWAGTISQSRSWLTTTGVLDWSNYPYFAGYLQPSSYDGAIMTKYVVRLQSDPDLVDHLGILRPSDDAATVHWGSNWITPRYEEWLDVISKCSVIETDVLGYPGALLRSNLTGAKVFIPYWTTLTLGTAPTTSDGVRLWSGTVSVDDATKADCAIISAGDITLQEHQRVNTYYVRPIYKE